MSLRFMIVKANIIKASLFITSTMPYPLSRLDNLLGATESPVITTIMFSIQSESTALSNDKAYPAHIHHSQLLFTISNQNQMENLRTPTFCYDKDQRLLQIGGK